MSSTVDIITIGDSTIDTFIKIHDATIECDINKQDCKICISYGDKIAVDSIAHTVAGNAANVAAGCSMLGLKTATYTNIGDDEQSHTIKKTLEAKGVSGEYIKVNEGKESNLSVILTFQGERTVFAYHQPWFYHLPDLPDATWVYLTSMAETFVNSNIIDEVCHYVDKSGAKLAFSPGLHQIKANVKRYPKMLERCYLLVVNLEEAKKILEIDIVEKVEIGDVISKLALLGPKMIVITDGEEGSYASDGKTNLKTGIFPSRLVEKTGAGDSYTSAFIAALNWGKSCEEAMVWGTINASHVIAQIGPQRGLMTKEEVERYAASVPEFKAAKL